MLYKCFTIPTLSVICSNLDIHLTILIYLSSWLENVWEYHHGIQQTEFEQPPENNLTELQSVRSQRFDHYQYVDTQPQHFPLDPTLGVLSISPQVSLT